MTSNAFHGISAAGHSRQLNGNVYNTHTNYYTIRQRRSDETLREEDLNRALLKAAAEGQTQRLEILTRRGANIDFADGQGLTSLHYAAFKGFEDTVRSLLHLGADVNAFTDVYGTPICLAALKGRRNVVELLLASRANPSVSSGWLCSPLHAACCSNDFATVKLLMDTGLPLHQSGILRWHFIENPLFLLDSDTVPMPMCVSCEPLMVAAKSGQTDIVSFLLDRWPCVDSPAYQLRVVHGEEKDECTGITALMWAAQGGFHETVGELLHRGADPNAETSYGSTPLMMAAVSGNEQCVQRLIEAGAIVDAKRWDETGQATAAMFAAMCGHLQALRLLVQAGASLEIESNEGYTALAFAAQSGRTSCVAYLIESGARIGARDRRGHTPLDLASLQGRQHCVEALLRAGAAMSVPERQYSSEQRTPKQEHRQRRRPPRGQSFWSRVFT